MTCLRDIVAVAMFFRPALYVPQIVFDFLSPEAIFPD